jgi:hypothetical protein
MGYSLFHLFSLVMYVTETATCLPLSKNSPSCFIFVAKSCSAMLLLRLHAHMAMMCYRCLGYMSYWRARFPEVAASVIGHDPEARAFV